MSASYDRVVREHLEAGTRLTPFIQTPEFKAAWERAERVEQDRRVSLMRSHLTVPGTTDVCLCGHVGYSTPGHLLHLYDVIAADVDPEYDD